MIQPWSLFVNGGFLKKTKKYILTDGHPGQDKGIFPLGIPQEKDGGKQ